MSITPTGSGLAVQTKQDTTTAKSTTPTNVAQDTAAIQPPLPSESVIQIKQDSQTSQSIVTKTPEEPPAEVDVEAVTAAVATLNDMMSIMKRDLEFEFDSELGKTIVTVRDSASQEVVRQLPSDAAIKLAKILQDSQGRRDGPLGQLLDIKT